MKLNPRVFRKITTQPFETQTLGSRTVEFHAMNESLFFDTYGKRGRFAVWTAEQNTYRVLIETSYYDAMKDFYQENINSIWIDFLERVTQKNKRINLMFIIPLMVTYLLAAIISSLYFPNDVFTVLLGILVVVFISNMFQNRVIRKSVQDENIATQNLIRQTMGESKFNKLVEAQEAHYKAFFQVPEDTVEAQEDASLTSETPEENEKETK
jgi:DNA-binding transcriptional regulator of glucitol operon